MKIAISYGRSQAELEFAESKLMQPRREPPAPPVADLSAAVAQALEAPFGYPPLRRALTPDDHVVILVDDQLRRLPELLIPLLEHLSKALVAPEAITLLCPPASVAQPWVDELPEAFQDVRLEVHDPDDRRHLSYLATTRNGRRVYLNRTAVDADQLVVLTRRGYDPLLGYAGGEGAIFPALSDHTTRQELAESWNLAAPGKKPWPIRQEANEVAWLLGAPFLLQVIEGSDGEVVHVLGGIIESTAEGQRLLDARWRIEVEQPADTVIATLVGDPGRQDFAALARALACAARVVKPGGNVVLLTEAELPTGPEIDLLRRASEPGDVLKLLSGQKGLNGVSLFFWAGAARQARIYLLSRFPAEDAEELFTVPLDHAGQVQRVVGSGTYLIIPEADKTMAVLVPAARSGE
jgi:nickel-dependent lactate racemase